MALLENPTNVQGPIPPEDAKIALRTGLYPDDSALNLVLKDTASAESYEAAKSWVTGWNTASVLYQSPTVPAFWDGTQVARANIPLYTLATAVNSLVPQVMKGLFSDDPFFMIQPRPSTRQQAARAIGALQSYQLDDINFREEVRLGVMNAVLFGTGIWKWGWETFTEDRKVYRRKNPPISIKNPLAAGQPGPQDIPIYESEEEVEEEVITEYIDRPVFEHIVNLRHVLVDPTLNVPDISKAKFVVHRLYLTWKELDRLRDRPGFKIPSRQKLLDLFLPPVEQPAENPSDTQDKNPLWNQAAEPRYEQATADFFNQPLEVLERWDADKYIVVLNRKLIICNDDNPYGHIPFLSVGWWDAPEAFWSMGLAKTIGAEQRLQQGITNAWLDQAALNLMGVYVRVRGKNVQSQNIRVYPGKIVEVDEKDGFKPLDRLPAVPEANEHLALSQARAEQVSGSNEATTGVAGQTAHSNLGRSAAGANLLAAGAGSRTSDFVEKLTSQVIVPFLYEMHEMNRAMLPLSTIRHILNDELQHEYMQDAQADPIELLNAKLKFSIQAASKMQARRNMAQALPIMVQFLTSEQTTQQLALQGKKVDVVEIMRMFFEVSDWRNEADVILDMTPEDQQRWQASTPAAAAALKAQASAAQQQQQFENKSKLIDQQNIALAGRQVLRQALEKSTLPMAITGEPGGEGFGANA